MTLLAGVRQRRGGPVVLAACPLPDLAPGSWVVVEDLQDTARATCAAEVVFGPAQVLDGHRCHPTVRIVRLAEAGDLGEAGAEETCLAAAQALWQERGVAAAPLRCVISPDGASAILWLAGDLAPAVAEQLGVQLSRRTGLAVQVRRAGGTPGPVPWLAAAPGADAAALRDAATDVLALLEEGHGARGFAGELPALGQCFALPSGEAGTVAGITYRGGQRGEPQVRVRLATGEEVYGPLPEGVTWAGLAAAVPARGERARRGTEKSRERAR
jgi:hypothetical protein